MYTKTQVLGTWHSSENKFKGGWMALQKCRLEKGGGGSNIKLFPEGRGSFWQQLFNTVYTKEYGIEGRYK